MEKKSEFEIEDNVLIKYHGNEKEVVVPENITAISDFAFQNCADIESVIVPKSVILIGRKAFENCSNLKNLVLSENLDEICEGAFNGCLNLECAFPKSLKKLYRKKVPWNKDEFGFYQKGMLLNNEKTSLYAVFHADENGKVIMPNSVKSIKEDAFIKGVSGLKILILPEVNNLDENYLREWRRTMDMVYQFDFNIFVKNLYLDKKSDKTSIDEKMLFEFYLGMGNYYYANILIKRFNDDKTFFEKYTNICTSKKISSLFVGIPACTVKYYFSHYGRWCSEFAESYPELVKMDNLLLRPDIIEDYSFSKNRNDIQYERNRLKEEYNRDPYGKLYDEDWALNLIFSYYRFDEFGSVYP